MPMSYIQPSSMVKSTGKTIFFLYSSANLFTDANISFKFLSSGGGATLEFIADGKLEALEWMEKEWKF